MSSLDAQAHEQVNAALRQLLADCLPAGLGGLCGIWDEPGQYRVEAMPDLSATFAEHRMAGLDVHAALSELADELASGRARSVEPGLIGLGLIGRAPTGRSGKTGTCVAAVADRIHLIAWPMRQVAPVWSIKSATKFPAIAAGGGNRANAAAVGLQSVLAALTDTRPEG
ncbi:hypothetical protein GCM10029992_36520 [Glycomyces albus]